MQPVLAAAVLFSLVAVSARVFAGVEAVLRRWSLLRMRLRRPGWAVRRRGQAAAIVAARRTLVAIGAEAGELGDAEVSSACRRFESAARRLIAAAGARRGRPAQVRRLLGPALEGTLEATRLLAGLWRSPRHGLARAEYLAYLAELRAAYEDAAQALERAAHERMTLEMDVVRERLYPGPWKPKG